MLHAVDLATCQTAVGELDFLWLELTNQCNLQCVHCYAESGPRAGAGDFLSLSDYISVLDQAHGLGCRKVQFIGGEPTLNRDLATLIAHADEKGFQFIEVFTNLTRLLEPLLVVIKARGVHVATSVYASVAGLHDKVTAVPGSFARTIGNLKKLISIGVPVRASVIAMEENSHLVEKTVGFLRRIGVHSVGCDRLRQIGRGASSDQVGMAELCGHCAASLLCVGPDGRVAPCIMSKAWSVGSVLRESLADIVHSAALRRVRHEIAAVTGQVTRMGCTPDRPYPCGPDQGGPCGPCNPNVSCGPNACRPV